MGIWEMRLGSYIHVPSILLLLPGAGKTYTMLGTEKEPGIMVLTLNDLFQRIQETSGDVIYRVTMAYMEVAILQNLIVDHLNTHR